MSALPIGPIARPKVPDSLAHELSQSAPAAALSMVHRCHSPIVPYSMRFGVLDITSATSDVMAPE